MNLAFRFSHLQICMVIAAISLSSDRAACLPSSWCWWDTSLRGPPGRRCWKVAALASHLEPDVGIALGVDAFHAQELYSKSPSVCLHSFMSENSHLAGLMRIPEFLPGSDLSDAECQQYESLRQFSVSASAILPVSYKSSLLLCNHPRIK